MKCTIKTKNYIYKLILIKIYINYKYIYTHTYLFSKDSKDSKDFCFLIPKDCLSRTGIQR